MPFKQKLVILLLEDLVHGPELAHLFFLVMALLLPNSLLSLLSLELVCQLGHPRTQLVDSFLPDFWLLLQLHLQFLIPFR